MSAKQRSPLADAIQRVAMELKSEAPPQVDSFLLDPQEVQTTYDQTREILFPEYFESRSLSLELLLHEWSERLIRLAMTERHRSCPEPGKERSLCAVCRPWAENVSLQLLTALPELRRILQVDMQAAIASDPAAQGPLEIFLCYPGFNAIISYRIAHRLWGEGARLIARLISEYAHTRTGIDIHPGAMIDAGFFIDHGTGVVVGETASIGKFVRLYQGVTLGALSLSQDNVQRMHGVKRHPTLEDEVIVYANATILGGDTVVGKGAVIGGNSWITSSIEPGTVVTRHITNWYGPKQGPLVATQRDV